MTQFSRAEHDAFLMGMLCSSFIHNGEQTVSMKKRAKKRKFSRVEGYVYKNNRICRNTFLYLFNCSKDRYQKLKLQANEDEPPVPKDSKRGECHKCCEFESL